MGFFSWNCRGCEHPLLSRWVTNNTNAWMENAVVIESEGSVLVGLYDGYGRVGERQINHALNEPGCWHRACWESVGKPVDHSPSARSDDQGFFFDPGDHDMDEPDLGRKDG